MDYSFLTYRPSKCPACATALPYMRFIAGHVEEAKPDWEDPDLVWGWFECSSCKKCMSARFLVFQPQHDGSPVFKIDFEYPTGSRMPLGLSETVAEYLQAAIACKGMALPCLIMCACTVECMLKDKDIGKDNDSLESRITQAMKEPESQIIKSMENSLTVIRKVGNIVRHAKKEKLTMQQVDAMLDYVIMLATMLYSYPAKMEQQKTETQSIEQQKE